jgi:ribosome-binding ATPase YchF (GTP1/OBG family)
VKATILGSEDSGKSDLFDILSGGKVSKMKSKLIGSANVPDNRVNELSDHFKPKKITFTQLNFLSVGLEPTFPYEDLRASDMFVLLLKAHSEYEGDTFDIKAAYEDIDLIFRLKDVELIENFIDRHKKDPKSKKEVEVCKTLIELIEKGETDIEPSLLQLDTIKNFGLNSIIPRIVVLNVDEDHINTPLEQEASFKAAYPEIKYSKLCVQLEKEISSMNSEDQEMMFSEYKIEEPGLNKLINAAYDKLGLMTFFTVGEDEVRAWTIHSGNIALEAAGKIHTDIQKGFIRAEIVHYNDFKDNEFSFKNCKDNGCFSLEGKEYVVQDGDIMHVRFNI